MIIARSVDLEKGERGGVSIAVDQRIHKFPRTL
jgi:hypothetical protein